MAEKTLTRPPFVQVLADALEQALPGAEVRYEPVRGDCYRFFVIYEAFDSMGHPERQRLVWDVAERVVNKADLWNVGMILTMGLEDLPSDDEDEQKTT